MFWRCWLNFKKKWETYFHFFWSSHNILLYQHLLDLSWCVENWINLTYFAAEEKIYILIYIKYESFIVYCCFQLQTNFNSVQNESIFTKFLLKVWFLFPLHPLFLVSHTLLCHSSKCHPWGNLDTRSLLDFHKFWLCNIRWVEFLQEQGCKKREGLGRLRIKRLESSNWHFTLKL